MGRRRTPQGRADDPRLPPRLATPAHTARALVEVEVHFDVDFNRNGLAVLGARLKAPLADRFDGLLVQSHAQRAQHGYLVCLAVHADHDAKHNISLVLIPARLIAELRFGTEYSLRSMNPAADPISATANPPAPARTDSRTAA